MANSYVNTENIRVVDGDVVTTEIINRALENTDANHEYVDSEKTLYNIYTYQDGTLTEDSAQFEFSQLYNKEYAKRCKVIIKLVSSSTIVILPFLSRDNSGSRYVFKNDNHELVYADSNVTYNYVSNSILDSGTINVAYSSSDSYIQINVRFAEAKSSSNYKVFLQQDGSDIPMFHVKVIARTSTYFTIIVQNIASHPNDVTVRFNWLIVS